jgi:cyd operon protein YbgT
MWYFTWVLGLGFAVLFGVLNAMWFEMEEDRGRELKIHPEIPPFKP